MDWIEGMRSAIDYIEEYLADDLEIEDIAKCACVSSFYFQRAFAMLCGFTVGEYIRRRRLTLAGIELVSTDAKIIDIALKYGYDSPDSFAKAFMRFHGSAPSAVRKDKAMVKSFAPLKIKFSLEGGSVMEYKIVEKEAFTVMGVSRRFSYETSFAEIPKFWTEHYQGDKCKVVCGMYGVCLDLDMDDNAKEFEYLIADNYIPWNDIPEGFKAVTIPKYTWAVFSCRGPLPKSLQDVNKKIYSEWFPNCKDYEIAAGYNIEMYLPPENYKNGTQDENYYCEIWIPVEKI